MGVWCARWAVCYAPVPYPNHAIRLCLLDHCGCHCGRGQVRHQLNRKDPSVTVPYCSFNGGLDVFIDVGNKQIGVDALQQMLGVKGRQTLHFGDQFTRTGNDLLTRRVCRYGGRVRGPGAPLVTNALPTTTLPATCVCGAGRVCSGVRIPWRPCRMLVCVAPLSSSRPCLASAPPRLLEKGSSRGDMF